MELHHAASTCDWRGNFCSLAQWSRSPNGVVAPQRPRPHRRDRNLNGPAAPRDDNPVLNQSLHTKPRLSNHYLTRTAWFCTKHLIQNRKEGRSPRRAPRSRTLLGFESKVAYKNTPFGPCGSPKGVVLYETLDSKPGPHARQGRTPRCPSPLAAEVGLADVVVVQELVAGARLGHGADLEHVRAVRDGERHVGVLLHEQDRGPGLVELPHD